MVLLVHRAGSLANGSVSRTLRLLVLIASIESHQGKTETQLLLAAELGLLDVHRRPLQSLHTDGGTAGTRVC